MNENTLRAFAEKVARLSLFRETLDPGEDPNAAQLDLDALTGDHDTLEQLIHEARKLCGLEG